MTDIHMTNDKFKYQIQMPKRSNKNSVKFKFSTEEQNTDHKILKMFQINICQTAKDKQSGSRPKFLLVSMTFRKLDQSL
jgi:hypothetical protein